MWRAERDAGFGQSGACGNAHGKGDAEVGHQRLSVLQEDVFRFDVAMHDAACVREVDRTGNRANDRDGLIDLQLLLSSDAVAQRLALNERHHVIEQPIGLAGIVERKDVRMLEACGDANLREKPIGADGGGNLRLQNLDCHFPTMAQIVSEVDDSHASGADDSVDVVATGQGIPQALQVVDHWGSAARSRRTGWALVYTSRRDPLLQRERPATFDSRAHLGTRHAALGT